MKSIKTVSVFGTSKAVPDDGVYQTAYEVGKVLAENGFCIANGGYGGTMYASAKGAVDAGGDSVGVTCTAFKHSRANDYIHEEIRTHSLDERLEKLIELGDAYVVLPGGTGTLLELAAVWEHKNKGFDNFQKPIIIFDAFWAPLIDLMEKADSGAPTCLIRVIKPDEIIRYL